jgi:hypothetical protein
MQLKSCFLYSTMRKEEVFCCLRRLSLSHSKRCSKGRFSTKSRPTRIGGAATRPYFDEFVGDDAILFLDDDVICKSCYMNVSLIHKYNYGYVICKRNNTSLFRFVSSTPTFKIERWKDEVVVQFWKLKPSWGLEKS